ncbi:hypothetical protein VF21_09532 [Pseudogymnoascus sp. 05NY08]|nr:hypothetical protein VF21_09532 [Pseudogymnoascus sp. 05NY08]
MALLNLNNDEAYQRYKALSVRHLGMFSFLADDKGKFIMLTRELFCRIDVMSREEAIKA